MLLDLPVRLDGERAPRIDLKEGCGRRLGVPAHGVLLIGTEVGNEVFRTILRQDDGIWRHDNEPNCLARPKGATLKFRDTFNLLMPIGIRAEQRLPCFWRCAQRQFLYAPWLVCGMPPRRGRWQRQHEGNELTDQLRLEDLMAPYKLSATSSGIASVRR